MAATAPLLRNPIFNVGYRLQGELPDGPDKAPVWNVTGRADEGAVRTLATALEVNAAPQTTPRGLVMIDGDRTLMIADVAGMPWNYYRSTQGSGWAEQACPTLLPSEAPSAPDVAVSCAVGGAGISGSAVASPGIPAPDVNPGPAIAPGEPAPGVGVPDVIDPVLIDPPLDQPLFDPKVIHPAPEPPDGPSEAEARAAALPLLKALGLDSADVRIERWPGTTSVVVDPRVGGLPTVGFTTWLSYDANLELVNASGWLGTVQKAATYPAITAAQAFDQLTSGPVPAMGIACRDANYCPEPAPSIITGARFGLMLDYVAREGIADQAVLVPAWLFTIADLDYPRGVVAVQPQFLQPPTSTPVWETTSGMPGSAPSALPPDLPVSPDPRR
jgi:hypothetical protein